eukprot:1272730-Amphidinium_carterae.1
MSTLDDVDRLRKPGCACVLGCKPLAIPSGLASQSQLRQLFQSALLQVLHGRAQPGSLAEQKILHVTRQ